MNCKWQAKWMEDHICKRYPPSNLPLGPLVTNSDPDLIPEDIPFGPDNLICIPSGVTFHRVSSFPHIDPDTDCPCGEYREAK